MQTELIERLRALGTLRSGASPAEIERAERALGVVIRGGYRTFLEAVE